MSFHPAIHLLIARGALLALAMLSLQPCRAGDLVVTVDTGTEMPFAHMVNGRLIGGIHKELGEALAKAMQRKPVFLLLPRRRIAPALEQGDADLLCMYLPVWMPGPFDWSRPFFRQTEIVVMKQGAPAVHGLSELAGKRIGMVFGYLHPELEQVLGTRFVREDAGSAEANLRKLTVGRVDYAVTTAIHLAYLQQQDGANLKLTTALPIKTSQTQCAVSRRGRITLAEVDRALAKMVADHTIEHILSHYKK
jgi:polar amino acid transport system substrate-binding protein